MSQGRVHGHRRLLGEKLRVLVQAVAPSAGIRPAHAVGPQCCSRGGQTHHVLGRSSSACRVPNSKMRCRSPSQGWQPRGWRSQDACRRHPTKKADELPAMSSAPLLVAPSASAVNFKKGVLLAAQVSQKNNEAVLSSISSMEDSEVHLGIHHVSEKTGSSRRMRFPALAAA